jgi:hypothetical protein
LIENTQMQRQTGASVDSFRNVMLTINAPQLSAPEQTKMIELN